MFLNMLSQEVKRDFLTLAVKAAEANGVVDMEEKTMLKAFASELQMPPIYSSDSSVEDILKAIASKATATEQRIVLFEIMGILFSDSVYDDEERKFVQRIESAFSINEGDGQRFLTLIQEYSDLYRRICKAVLE